MWLPSLCSELVFLIISLHPSFSADVTLISNYFNLQSTDAVTSCDCSRKDALLLTRHLSAEKLLHKVYTPHSKDNLQFKARHYVQGVFIDLTCEYNKQLLQKGYGAMNTSYKWLAWMASEDFTVLNISPLGVNTDMIVATDDGKLYDVYRKSLIHQATVILIGNWTRSGEIALGPKPFRDLEGVTLRGSVFGYELNMDKNNYSEVMLNKSIQPTVDGFHRFAFGTIWDLITLYKYKIEPVFANASGYLLPNGKFVGMVGDIADNKSDIGMSPCQEMADRAKVVRFLPALRNFRLIFAFLNPQVIGTYKGLLLPLSLEVWVSIVVLIAIMTVTYYGMQKYSVVNEGDKSLSAGFLYAIAVLSQQGLLGEPRTLSFKLMGTLLLMFTFIISAYYNAAIMNGLLSPARIPIKSLQQLADSTFEIGIRNLPYSTYKTNVELYFMEDLKKKMQKTKNSILGLKTGVERMRTSKFAFGDEDALIRTEAARTFNDIEICDLVEIVIIDFPLSVPIQKNSPYRELFVRGTLLIRETGIARRLNDHWYPKPVQCMVPNRFSHVSLEAVGFALTVFVLGIVLSCTFFLFEFMIKKKQDMVRTTQVISFKQNY